MTLPQRISAGEIIYFHGSTNPHSFILVCETVMSSFRVVWSYDIAKIFNFRNENSRKQPL